MRCKICNELLNTSESVAKDRRTDEYLDTCNKCNSDIFATLSEFEFQKSIDVYEKPIDFEEEDL